MLCHVNVPATFLYRLYANVFAKCYLFKRKQIRQKYHSKWQKIKWQHFKHFDIFFTFKEESKLGKMVKKHTEKLSIFVGPASNFKKDKFTDLFHAKRIIGIKWITNITLIQNQLFGDGPVGLRFLINITLSIIILKFMNVHALSGCLLKRHKLTYFRKPGKYLIELSIAWKKLIYSFEREIDK